MSYDDDDRDPGRRRDIDPGQGGPPGTARAAGFLWIVVGLVIVIARVVDVVLTFGMQIPGQPTDPAQQAGTLVGTAGAALLALLYVIVGIQVVQGKAKDIMGFGIGSILLGILCGACNGMALVGAMALSSGQVPLPAGFPMHLLQIMLVLSTIGAFSGLGLLVAGFLAISGRDAYKAWRARTFGDDRRDRHDGRGDYGRGGWEDRGRDQGGGGRDDRGDGRGYEDDRYRGR